MLFFGIGLSNDSTFEVLKDLVFKANGDRKSFQMGKETIDFFYHIVDENGFIDAFTRMQEAFEGRTSSIKTKLEMANLIKKNVESALLQSQEYLKKMVSEETELQKAMMSMNDINQEQLNKMVESRIAKLNEELNTLDQKIVNNNKFIEDEKVQKENKEKEIQSLDENVPKLKEDVSTFTDKLAKKRTSIDDKRNSEIEAFKAKPKKEHLENLLKLNIILDEYRLKTITEEYLKCCETLVTYEVSLNSLRAFISRVTFLLTYITQDMKTKTEQTWLKNEYGFRLLVKHYSHFITMDEAKTGECFQKILYYIMDNDSIQKMKLQLENICMEDPVYIVKITENSQTIKEYIKKNTKRMIEYQEEKKNEIEEINRKISALRKHDMDNESFIKPIKDKIKALNDGLEESLEEIKKICKRKKKELEDKKDIIDDLKEVSKDEKKENKNQIDEEIEKLEEKVKKDRKTKEKEVNEQIEEQERTLQDKKKAKEKEIEDKIENLRKKTQELKNEIENIDHNSEYSESILMRIGSAVKEIFARGNNLIIKGMIGCSVRALTESIMPNLDDFKKSTYAIMN